MEGQTDNNESAAVEESETVAAASAAVGLAQATAALAEVEAAQTVAEVHDDIKNVENELEIQEGSIEWLRNQITELRETVMRQQGELSTLTTSLEEARAESRAAREAAEIVTEAPPSNLNDPNQETSSETPMEHPESVEVESLAQETPAVEKSPKKRSRTLV